MKIFPFIVVLVALTACKTSQLEVVKPDGTKIKAKDTRFWMKTDAQFGYHSETNSHDITLGVKSASDTELAKTLLEAGVSLLKK